MNNVNTNNYVLATVLCLMRSTMQTHGRLAVGLNLGSGGVGRVGELDGLVLHVRGTKNISGEINRHWLMWWNELLKYK